MDTKLFSVITYKIKEEIEMDLEVKADNKVHLYTSSLEYRTES
jgi:hypothetical protein